MTPTPTHDPGANRDAGTDQNQKGHEIMHAQISPLLSAWAKEEFSRQMEEHRTCHICGDTKEEGAGYHATCDNCGAPVCDRCAIQANDGHFCPTCPHEMPF